MPSSALDFQPPPRFQILSRLGEGGMGVVYRAYDREQRTRVALKTMRFASPDAVLRFKNEFRALQDLQHPNLISLGELICEGDQWFFTMELVDGVDFRAWVRGTEDGPDDFATPSMERTDSFDGVTAEDIAPTRARRVPTDATAGRGFHEGRLRAALQQLAQGLHALHAAQKVHRDIKPSNILVAYGGRLVLLDFGLATSVGVSTSASVPSGWSDGSAVGTADYMAPEQAAGKPASPAADWYAVGVLLYEVLTGERPFRGTALEVLIAKQREEPPSPSTINPKIPADIDALCCELLRFEPSARPSGAEVMRRLGVADAPPASNPTSAPPFIGRSGEVKQLERAFAETLADSAAVVFVHGESGVGKSALVQHVMRSLHAEHGALVLAGRCYERETVPYKAVDGLIDALARHLGRLRIEEAAAVLPLHASLLAQVFPVLRRAEAVAQAPLPRQKIIDPQELRVRAFAALRELLVRLARRRPTVLVIDDLQWADADSLALLEEVMRPPEAPPLLLVATVRRRRHPLGGVGAALPSEVASLAASVPGSVELALERLSPGEAREMVSALLSRHGLRDAPSVDAIAEEAGGHPLFIDELVRHLSTTGASGDGPVILDEALWSRVEKLDPSARRLLELIAVAGGPMTLQVAAQAAQAAEGAGFGEIQKLVSTLRVSNLVRTSGARTVDTVEPYHDRVREAVLWHLDGPTSQELHRRLALALEASGRDELDALAIHWRGAGDPARAARYAVSAAEQAAAALAFDRAARLYRMALELAPERAPEERRRIVGALGDALANAGRGGAAAESYLLAADGASTAEALELRRRAAEQLMRHGRIDEGLAAMSEVLAVVGMKLPSSAREAQRWLIGRRLQLKLRGYDFRERDASEISPQVLTRIDVEWSAAIGLSMAQPIFGAYFHTRGLLDALAAGEPNRVTRALALEVSYSGIFSRRSYRSAGKLAKRASEVAEKYGQPHALGMSVGCAGTQAYLAGDWPRARALCDEATGIFRDRCTGATWELHVVELFSLLALSWMGELALLGRLIPERVRDSQARGDLYAVANLRSLPTLSYLARDDPESTRREASEAMRQWSRKGFYLQSLRYVFGRTHIDLYVGDGRAAYDRLLSVWPQLEGSRFLRFELLEMHATYLRGTAALATAADLPEGSERRTLLREAAAMSRRIEREALGWAEPCHLLLDAGVAVARGDDERAAALLARAATAAERQHMTLFAQVARRRRGQLVGGDEGRALIGVSEAWMQGQQVKNPERLATVLAPLPRAS